MTRKIRVLVAKPGLDEHDRGAVVVARGLRDAGMEVIYTGLRQTPDQIVRVAIREDVDVVGLSIHSGSHMTLIPMVSKLLRQNGAMDIVVIGGGTIPETDISALKEGGWAEELFPPGTSIKTIVDWIKNNIKVD